MISVIVPTFHESETIQDTLAMLRQRTKGVFETVIVDASDDDATIKSIEVEPGTKVIRSKKGRSYQMNAGAQIAKGDTLLFLHADTILPSGWDTEVEDALLEADYGCFQKRFSNTGRIYWFMAFTSNVRARFLREVLGDSAFFVKRDVFDAIGGFPQIGIMEDLAIGERLAHHQFAFINTTLITSSRRFEEHGVLRTVYLMWKMRFLYMLGKHPDGLARLYV